MRSNGTTLTVRAIIGASISGLFIASNEVRRAGKPVIEHGVRLVDRDGAIEGWANLYQDDEGTFYVLLNPEKPTLHASLRPFVQSITMVDSVILAPRLVGKVAPGSYTSTSGKCTATVVEQKVEEGSNRGRIEQKVSFRVQGNDANALNLFFDAVMCGDKESNEERAARPPKAADAPNVEQPAPAATTSPVTHTAPPTEAPAQHPN